LLIPFAAAAGLFVGFAAYAVQTYAAAAHTPMQVTSFAGVPASAPVDEARPGSPLAPEASALPARPLPTMTTVHLAVSPRTASVEIDGKPAPVSAGLVDVSGTMGSTHKVRVFVGKRQTVTDVAIVDTGIMPPRVSLVIPRPRAASAAGDPGAEVVAAPDPTPSSPAGLAQRDPDGL
jgi:serine/threonine-protein kinase